MRTIQEELEQLRQSHLYRSLKTVRPLPGGMLRTEAGELVNFSSNDYLGLAQSATLTEAFREAVGVYGSGAGSSRLICGSSPAHAELEKELAVLKGTDAAISFATGYSASVGAITALAGKGDVVILDKLAHASLIDGARLSGAFIRVFPHNHLGKLEDHLAWAMNKVGDQGRILVVTESIFSMDGDRSPLAEMVTLKQEAGAILLVDEAHAVGVVGPEGRGLTHGLNVDVQMGTLSKAIGVSGGYVCGSEELIQLLINKSRSFIYSTAPPSAVAATAAIAVKLLRSAEGQDRRSRLWHNIGSFSEAMKSLSESESASPESAILPVLLGDAERALETAAKLEECGFFVPAIRYPTVPREGARLRIALSASHSEEQIAGLISSLQEILRD